MNGILLIDKPSDWTSHDVVAKCRGLLGERRIGHSGTLDPMATGLLTLFAGRATRAISYMPGIKRYVASFRFGLETDTQDQTGRVIKRCDFIPEQQALLHCLPRFTGEIWQTPPMVSAVKIGGQRLYKLAREGREVERPPRKMMVYALEWLGEKDGEHRIALTCSAGFYVRTLIHDLGIALGSLAVMTALRRTAVDGFSVDDAVAIEDAATAPLLPIDTLFAHLPAVTIPDSHLAKVRNGAPFPLSGADLPEPARCRCYDATGAFWLLGESRGGDIITVKSFFEV